MRTHINLYMVVFITTVISTGLTAQDSIEEITVTSSYVTHSDDQANDPIHVLSEEELETNSTCLLYTSPSPRDRTRSRMPSSA